VHGACSQPLCSIFGLVVSGYDLVWSFDIHRLISCRGVSSESLRRMYAFRRNSGGWIYELDTSMMLKAKHYRLQLSVTRVTSPWDPSVVFMK
jgi:hypothetical protein